ncbi:hypothetical protein [Nonomuraea sp. NPDC049709]|uniref:hypothetical protein n=1 Tax=Nonomuraea sp. NPDC049709 TaxID=3154736 RepID=UPI0034151A95
MDAQAIFDASDRAYPAWLLALTDDRLVFTHLDGGGDLLGRDGPAHRGHLLPPRGPSPPRDATPGRPRLRGVSLPESRCSWA